MEGSNNPLVSVLIPTHNRSHELKSAIESVLNQSITDFEILILDDASTENLADVVYRFGDHRIRLIRNEQKTNANVLRNMGLVNARGLYTAFLDSDDSWLPMHLETKISLLEDNKADLIFGSCFIDNGSERRYANSREISENSHPVNYLLGLGFAPIPSWVLRTVCGVRILFDESLHRHQDYDFFIRFAQTFKVKASWEPTLIVNWTKGITRSTHLQSEIIFLQQYEQYLDKRLLCDYLLERFYTWSKINDMKGMSHYRNRIAGLATFITFNQYRQVLRNKSAILFPIHLVQFMIHIVMRTLKKDKFKP